MVDVLAALVGRRSLDRPAFTYNGYPLDGLPISLVTTLRGNREEIGSDLASYVNGAYKGSGVVSAIELLRMFVFSEARPMYRRLVEGRPGDLFSTPSLAPLRDAGPGYMGAALLEADLAGNHFGLRSGNRVHRLRPDWVSIVLGVADEDVPSEEIGEHPEAVIVGYIYRPGGRNDRVLSYTVDQVAHWAPLPDPLARYKGMSWLTPVIREVEGDKLAAAHKNAFFENGATPNLIIKNKLEDIEMFKKWVALFREEHEGVANAYKSLHLGAGADATVVGSNFQQLDFKVVQGAGESRIAAASGVGAVMAQFSEGMAGSSLNSGNYAAARRRVADGLFRPLWRGFFDAYSRIVTVPRNSELWYDEASIAFLREDAKDAADIQSTRAQSTRTLIDAGYEPESVVKAITNDDLTLLVHSGLYSVQLQPPGTTQTIEEPPA